MAWGILVPVFAIFMVFAPAIIIPLTRLRQRFLLDMKREEARIAEAKAKELELAQRRAELEYREALLELERYDRRTGRVDRPLPSELYPPELNPPKPPDPPDLPESDPSGSPG